jgi:hypothetical protein
VFRERAGHQDPREREAHQESRERLGLMELARRVLEAIRESQGLRECEVIWGLRDHQARASGQRGLKVSKALMAMRALLELWALRE